MGSLGAAFFPRRRRRASQWTARPGTLYVATWFAGVFRSDDAGATWRDLSDYGTVADVVNVNV
jgi:hypothetical protein